MSNNGNVGFEGFGIAPTSCLLTIHQGDYSMSGSRLTECNHSDIGGFECTTQHDLPIHTDAKGGGAQPFPLADKGDPMIRPLPSTQSQEQRELKEWFRLHKAYVRALDAERRAAYSQLLAELQIETSPSNPDLASQLQRELAAPLTFKRFEQFVAWWKSLPTPTRVVLEGRYTAGLEKTIADGKKSTQEAIQRGRARIERG